MREPATNDVDGFLPNKNPILFMIIATLRSSTTACTIHSYRFKSNMKYLAFTFLVLSALSQFTGVQGFSVSNSPKSRASELHLSPLFKFQPNARGTPNPRSPYFFNRKRLEIGSVSSRTLKARLFTLVGKIRRSLIGLAIVTMIWFGAAGARTPPAHASVAPAVAAPQSRNIMSRSLDSIVDRYVQDHMFDDDVYDPVESIYREATSDKVKGTHPRAIKEITASVLGQDAVQAEPTQSSNGVGDWIMHAVGFLQRKGLSETTAILLLTGTAVVVGPTVFLLAATMAGMQNKRQIQRVMKKRYGDTYT